MALSVTVWAVLRQPLAAPDCRPVALVVGALVSTTPPLMVVRITPAAPATAPRPGSANETAARAAEVPPGCAAQVEPPLVERRTVPAEPQTQAYFASP